MRLLAVILLTFLLSITMSLSVFSRPEAVSFVDKHKVTVGEYIKLTVEITGSNNVETPQLMGMDNFAQVNMSTKQSFQLIGNKASRTATFTYTLVPKRAGTFPVGEAYINVNGKRLHTKPITLTVEDTVYHSNNKITKKQNQFKFNKTAFLVSSVSNQAPYVNEQILYTLRFYYTGRVTQFNLELPQFKDFIVEPLDSNKQYVSYEKGRYYNVLEQSYALFPTKSGNLVISPSKTSVELIVIADPLDSIFGGQEYKNLNLKSSPIKLKVQKLPEPPAGFKNSVGEFKIDTKINTTSLEEGETAKLKIIVWGKGNIQNIQSPQFVPDKDFENNFKMYPATPITQITDKSNYIYGQKVFNYDVVALNAGTYHIPYAEYTYFDPDTKMYKQLRSSTIEVKVKPGNKKDKLTVANATGSYFYDPNDELNDIITITTGKSTLIKDTITKQNYIVYGLVFLIPLLSLAGTFIYLRYKENQEANIHLIKKRQAYRKAKDSLNKLKPYVKHHQSKEFFANLANILKEYIGSKTYQPSGSLTSKDVEMHLQKNNVSSKTILFITEILKLCEQSEYSSGEGMNKKVSIAFKDAKKVLKWLEKELK